MCGIIGHVGRNDAIGPLLTGLENLEYRGYDSAGIAVKNGSGIEIEKRSGKVDGLVSTIEPGRFGGHLGIGHTRWSTHGPPTDENAHPHTDVTESVAVVHNGVIENHGLLRERLESAGFEFSSETDTEVVPHLLQSYLDRGLDAEAAFRRTIEEIEGSYAIAAICEGSQAIYCAREGSPLVIGFDGDGYYLASDIPAFLEYTDEVLYLEDGDVAVLSENGLRITDLAGEPVRRDREIVEWDSSETAKGQFDHFMLKEITEQPTSLAQALEGRYDPVSQTVSFDALDDGTFDAVETVVLVACGTSAHAAQYGAIALRRAGVDAVSILANEFELVTPPIDERTLVVAVTQSGETADTLSAVRHAADQGAHTLAMTNVVGSTAARETDDQVFIRAGPEIGVAATKTFSSQAILLTLLAHRIAVDATGESGLPIENIGETFEQLPTLAEHVLDHSEAKSIARRYDDEAADGEEDAPESFEELQEQLDTTAWMDVDLSIDELEAHAADLEQAEGVDADAIPADRLAEIVGVLKRLESAAEDARKEVFEPVLKSHVDVDEEIGDLVRRRGTRTWIADDAAAFEAIEDAGGDPMAVASVDRSAFEDAADALGVDVAEHLGNTEYTYFRRKS